MYFPESESKNGMSKTLYQIFIKFFLKTDKFTFVNDKLCRLIFKIV